MEDSSLGGFSPYSLLRSSNSVEYYSPVHIVEAAREVMGSIDLDPASCIFANKQVNAEVFYTEDIDGLSKPWFGNVWLNPPYGKIGKLSSQAVWSQRLIQEYTAGNVTQAILLINATTDRKWFTPLCDYAVCFAGRLQHYTEDLAKTIPIHGSALVYFGHNKVGFARIFEQFGPVMERILKK